MANEENLIPMSKRSKKEARELGSKGGVASGKSRRKKADLRKAMEVLLSLDVRDPKLKKNLEDMGMDGSNESLLVFATFQQAVKGNQRATENVLKMANLKDKYDISEQRERIKAQKLANKKAESSQVDETSDALEKYFKALGEEVDKNVT